MTILLVEKDTLNVNDVISSLLETETFWKQGNSSQAEGLVAKGALSHQRGRNKYKGFGNKKMSHSKSKRKNNKFKCYYCKKEGHMKKDYIKH